jgi:hypothetical protein
MATRSTETTLTFRRRRAFSAGTYRLVVDQDETPAPSFLAFGRTATLPLIGASP